MDDKNLVMCLELNHFANLCGHFFNAAYRAPQFRGANNGYNCGHPDQEEWVDVGGQRIGSCYSWSCPMGYPPEADDLVKWGVIDEEDVCPGESTDFDYIVVTDTEMLKWLLEHDVKTLAEREDYDGQR